MDLSRRRAQTVIDYFKKYKDFFDKEYVIDPPVGLGATRPVADNMNPDGSHNRENQEKNRRVEIYLYEK